MATLASDTAAFEALHAELARRLGDDPRRRMRDRAFARFLELGWPTTRLEDWKATSVSPISRIQFRGPDPRGAEGRPVGPDGALALRFSGGLAAPGSCPLPGGAVATSFSRAGGGAAGLLEEHLGRIAPIDDRAFVALNTAMHEDGALVWVPKGVVLEEPIWLGFDMPASPADPVAAHPRILVVLEEAAQAEIVEVHSGRGTSLTNEVAEIRLGPAAVLRHSVVQAHDEESAFHVSTTRVVQDRDSSYSSRVISLGARLSRHDLDVELAGEGASCRLDGLSYLAGRQHADHHTTIDHAVPHCSSAQTYKGVYDADARGVFRGKVIVRKDAQQTEAHQQNRNLILSERALVDTRPQLEIHADDVRCTHGATIGQLDADALFYLRARGIGEDEARRVLVAGFAQEIIAPLRDWARQLVEGVIDERAGAVA